MYDHAWSFRNSSFNTSRRKKEKMYELVESLLRIFVVDRSTRSSRELWVTFMLLVIEHGLLVSSGIVMHIAYILPENVWRQSDASNISR